MKKFILLAALSLVIVGAFVMPAAAQQQADLTALAKYFPADSAAYLSIRTDDNMIETVNTLVAKFGAAVPGSVTTTFDQVLDMLASEGEPGGTFASAMRPWLGDSVAFGIGTINPGATQDYTVAVSITDEDKAKAFFKMQLGEESYQEQDKGGASVYTPTDTTFNNEPTYIYRSDVLLVTTNQSVIDGSGVLSSTLSSNADFKSGLALLPEPSYDGIAYVDTPTILNAMIQSRQSDDGSGSDAAAMQMFTSALSSLKPEAFGLTMLDDQTIALDAVSPSNPNSTSPLVMNMSAPAIDPTFAQHIPSDVPFVVEGTDLYDSYQAAITNLQTIAQSMPQDSSNPNGMNMQNLQTGLWGLGFIVRGLTGLEIKDAAGWMTGDYAMYMGFAPAFTDSQSVMSAMQALPVDFGVTIAATDAAAAQKVYDGLSRSLLGIPAKNVTVTEDTLDGGTKALVLTLTGPNMPYPVEILAATGNGVFAVGTRRMVTQAINPKNGLDTNSTYSAATQYLLKDANEVVFLSGTALAPLARVLVADGNPPDVRQQGKQFVLLLKLFQSATISVSDLPNNGGRLARVVWTLPQ